MFDQSCEVLSQDIKACVDSSRYFIHVKVAIDFELQTVDASSRLAVSTHNFYTRIWNINAHAVAKLAQVVGYEVGQITAACCAVAVAQAKIRSPLPLRKAG